MLLRLSDDLLIETADVSAIFTNDGDGDGDHGVEFMFRSGRSVVIQDITLADVVRALGTGSPDVRPEPTKAEKAAALRAAAAERAANRQTT